MLYSYFLRMFMLYATSSPCPFRCEDSGGALSAMQATVISKNA